jgi:hypothetical protein
VLPVQTDLDIGLGSSTVSFQRGKPKKVVLSTKFSNHTQAGKEASFTYVSLLNLNSAGGCKFCCCFIAKSVQIYALLDLKHC